MSILFIFVVISMVMLVEAKSTKEEISFDLGETYCVNSDVFANINFEGKIRMDKEGLLFLSPMHGIINFGGETLRISIKRTTNETYFERNIQHNLIDWDRYTSEHYNSPIILKIKNKKYFSNLNWGLEIFDSGFVWKSSSLYIRDFNYCTSNWDSTYFDGDFPN